jgi:hypothetical protein
MQHKPETKFCSVTVLSRPYVNISTLIWNVLISGRHKVKYHPMFRVGELISVFCNTPVMLNLLIS